jgi:hypothetical protein
VFSLYFWEIGTYTPSDAIIILTNRGGSDRMNIKGMDITKNLRLIESLKADLLLAISQLYSEMSDEKCDDLRGVTLDTLSDSIIICYLLARRMGIDYSLIDRQISTKIRLGLLQEHDAEKYFGDLSALYRTRNNPCTSDMKN